MSKRTSLGRQKIAIAKIHNKNRLQVTFSKRRTGLFKKASELCTLCGVEIAILVFSPTNKVFSFGHPDVNSIIDRFRSGPDQVGGTTEPDLTKSTALRMLESYSRNDNIRHLNMVLAQMYGQIEEERERGKNLDRLIKQHQQQWCVDDDSDEFKLQQVKMNLEELKKKVKNAQINRSCNNAAGFVPALHQSAADPEVNISQLIDFAPENAFFASL